MRFWSSIAGVRTGRRLRRTAARVLSRGDAPCLPASDVASTTARPAGFQFRVARVERGVHGGRQRHAAVPRCRPAGFTQTIVASEPDYGDVPDMNTLNETGPRAGRYLYQAHELGSNGSVSVTDLLTGASEDDRAARRLGVARSDRLDAVGHAAVRRRDERRAVPRSRIIRRPWQDWCTSCSSTTPIRRW